ncbi:universal stress protein [Mariniluteicoccus endophyticus]
MSYNGVKSSRPRVVVGVDGSEDARRAVAYGVREAKRRGCELHLAHAVDDAVLAGAWGVVYDPDLLRDSGEQATADARAYALEVGADEADVTSDVYMGSPGAVLTRLSEEADTIVVGRRAISGLERLFVGSTSVGVAATAHCPVIMVSAASHEPVTGGLNLIGAGVDATDRGKETLAYAFEEAAHRGARLEILHACELPTGFFADNRNREEREAALAKAAEKGISELVGPLRQQFPDVEVTTTIVKGHPVEELTRRSVDFDLLVVGVHGVGLPGFAPGATIRALMAHGACPLALIRHGVSRRR